MIRKTRETSVNDDLKYHSFEGGAVTGDAEAHYLRILIKLMSSLRISGGGGEGH